MRKRMFVVVLLPLLVLTLAGVSQAWQGRMGGMGDPYGLVADESDFLIHPAKIAKGEGLRFYGDYRFTYTGVLDWDYTKDSLYPPSGVVHRPYRGSGDEWAHNALLGGAFPLGPGRMGFFFEYEGKRGDYSGDKNWIYWGTPFNGIFNMDNALDAFALRLLYGLPVGGFNLGGEVQFAYRQDENETFLYDSYYGMFTNDPYGAYGSSTNLLPFMFPYDSHYWEALFKGSLEGKVGPLDLEFTMRGGFIFAGDNKLEGTGISWSTYAFDLDGGVEGWRIGGDLWLRYPVDTLTLPFLVRIDYQEKTRDGVGYDVNTGNSYDHESTEKSFQIEVGGGVDKELAQGTRIAGGIYYGYLQNTNSFWFFDVDSGGFWDDHDHCDYPDHQEHQIIVRLSGEKEFSPAIALRMGLRFFYGWVTEDLNYTYVYSMLPTPNPWLRNVSLDGSHWGIGASLGGTVKFQPVTLEPFIGAGYQQLDLDGGGYDMSYGLTPVNFDKARNEWSIGGGLSILFDL